jgi:5,10-methylenetetrahydromethanopterin reductase
MANLPGVVALGVNLIPDGEIAEAVRLAEVAEGSGFTRCRVYDEGLVTHDVHVVSAAVLQATQRLVVGPGITNPYTRHPAQTAAALASLYELSGGRVSAGFGPGGSLTLAPLAIDRQTPLAALDELITVCRGLWSGEVTDVNGSTVQLRAARLGSGSAEIPIWIAGRGPRVLALGGRRADGVMLDFLHEAVLSEAIDIVTEAASSVERAVALSYSTSVVMCDADLEAVRPHMTYRLVDSPSVVKERIGLDPVSEAAIRTAMSDGLEAAAAHVRDEWVLPFVIHGSPSDCSRQLTAMIDRYGFSEFLLPVFGMDDPADYIVRVGSILSG